MTYSVLLSRQAKRYFASAPVPLARRLAQVFEVLESDPRPSGSKPLKGTLEGLVRIRVGNLRVIYEVLEDAGAIRVVKISPRGDAY